MTSLAALGDISKSLVRTPGGGATYRAIARLNPQTGKYESAGISRAVRRTVERDKRVRLNNSSRPAPGGRDAAARAQYSSDWGRVKAGRHFEHITGVKRETFGGPVPKPGMSQADEVASLQRTRQVRANDKAKQVTRDNRKERAYVKERNKEASLAQYMPGHHQSYQTGAVAALGGAGAVGYLASRKQKVAKADVKQHFSDNRDKYLAGAAGGIAGGGAMKAAYTIGGVEAKKHISRRRRDFLVNNPSQREPQRKAWKAHLRSHGFERLLDAPDEKRTQIKLTTPKTVHDWKLDRALAVKNLKPVERGLKGGAVLGGAALGVAAIRRRDSRRNG